MPDDDNVIQFVPVKVVPDDPDRVFRRKRTDYSKPVCRHRHYEVAMDEADVSCQDCKAQLDPWQVLRDLATEHENTWVHLSMQRKEREQLRKEIEALKKERAKQRRGLPRDVTSAINMRAQLGRLDKADADGP